MASARTRPPTDWREATLARMRTLILEADPDMLEERKWRKAATPDGVPVWSHGGIVCTGETYKQAVKLTFARGARLPDPAHLFNASLEAGTRRAIDIREGETVNARAFKALVKAAVALNDPAAKPARKPVASKPTTSAPGRVILLSGGNPQIAKGDGDAPVQAYIAAMPEWKQDIGRWLDALVTKHVPAVRKAVKWNSPFYGVDGNGWFLNFHVYARFVKVAFFNGTSLQPMPPGPSKSDGVRYLDIREGDNNAQLTAQLTDWVKQAAALPGWIQ